MSIGFLEIKVLYLSHLLFKVFKNKSKALATCKYKQKTNKQTKPIVGGKR